MPLIAGSIIEEARDTALQDSSRVPNKVLLRTLKRLERGVFEAVLDMNEDALATERTYDSFDLAVLDELTLPLPEHYLFLGARVKQKGWESFVEVVLTPNRRGPDANLPRPAARIIGSDLKLIEVVADEWGGAEELIIRYVPVPAEPTNLTSELVLPVIAENYLVLGVADFIHRSLGIKDPELTTRADRALASLVNVLATQDDTVTWTIRKVV